MQQSPPIRLAVFDMAGTTVEDLDQVGIAFQEAFSRAGHTISIGEISPLMGYKKPEAIRIMLDRLKADTGAVDAIHEDFIGLMIKHYQQKSHVKPLPNVESTLQQLQESGIRIALNTGFSRDIAETILNSLQWQEKGLVNFLAASDDVERGRPDPAMIRAIMAEAEITDPLQVIKIGDTEVDIREARNAGCRYAISVTTGAFTRDALSVYQPDFIIDDIAGVLDIVRNA